MSEEQASIISFEKNWNVQLKEEKEDHQKHKDMLDIPSEMEQDEKMAVSEDLKQLSQNTFHRGQVVVKNSHSKMEDDVPATCNFSETIAEMLPFKTGGNILPIHHEMPLEFDKKKNRQKDANSKIFPNLVRSSNLPHRMVTATMPSPYPSVLDSKNKKTLFQDNSDLPSLAAEMIPKSLNKFNSVNKQESKVRSDCVNVTDKNSQFEGSVKASSSTMFESFNDFQSNTSIIFDPGSLIPTTVFDQTQKWNSYEIRQALRKKILKTDLSNADDEKSYQNSFPNLGELNITEKQKHLKPMPERGKATKSRYRPYHTPKK